MEEEYITFCTPECAKEIDTYLGFRKRHGEIITNDSFLFVKKFNIDLKRPIKGKQFTGRSLHSIEQAYHNLEVLRDITFEIQITNEEIFIRGKMYFKGFLIDITSNYVKIGRLQFQGMTLNNARVGISCDV